MNSNKSKKNNFPLQKQFFNIRTVYFKTWINNINYRKKIIKK